MPHNPGLLVSDGVHQPSGFWERNLFLGVLSVTRGDRYTLT